MLTTRISLIVGTLAFASSLMATPQLRLTSGMSSVTITDGGVGDTNPLSGLITASTTVGTFAVSTVTGATKPAAGFGSASNPILFLQSLEANSATSGTLEVALSEVGYGGSLSTMLGNLTASLTKILPTTTGSAKFEIWSGTGLFDKTTQLLTTLTVPPDINTFGPVPSLSSYSLTLIATITQSAGITSITASYTQVPEPGFYGLLAIGLSGLFFIVRRRTGSIV